MKRLLCIVTALLVAAMFALPAAAIINLDGSEPEWTGDPGIRPLTETLDGIDLDGFIPIEPYSEGLSEINGIEYIGEPTDNLDETEEAEDSGINRSALARDQATDAETETEASFGVRLVLIAALGLAGAAALAVLVVVLARVRRKK